jgi:hypothetical protein
MTIRPREIRSSGSASRPGDLAVRTRFSIGQYMVATAIIAVFLELFLVLTDGSLFGAVAGFVTFAFVGSILALSRRCSEKRIVSGFALMAQHVWRSLNTPPSRNR